jgi:hypothetical protein
MLLVGCASRGDLKDLEQDLKNTREDLKQDIYDTHHTLKDMIDAQKGCTLQDMVVDLGDDDKCISPSVKYCVTPGLVYMPNTGDKDNCQSPRSYCEGNPDDPNC